MAEADVKYRHDLKRAIRAMNNVIELAKRGYDFKTERGKQVLDEAEAQRKWLESKLGISEE